MRLAGIAVPLAFGCCLTFCGCLALLSPSSSSSGGMTVVRTAAGPAAAESSIDSSGSSGGGSPPGQLHHFLVRRKKPPSGGSSGSLEKQPPPPHHHCPLIICVGTAQTADNWLHHAQPGRDVLIYQASGLGTNYQAGRDVSLPRQAQQVHAAILSAFPETSSSGGGGGGGQQVDIAGFSLGGRIAMAVACAHPHLIRKLHLTGVAIQRSDYGHLTIASWLDHLRRDDLRAFAWSAILASYSASWLRQNEAQLPQWLRGVCEHHTAAGLLALLEQTNDADGPWSVAGMAERLAGHRHIKGRLLVGERDLLAPFEHAEALAAALQWDAPTVVPAAGHAVPLEAPRAWRNHLLEYLDHTKDDA